MVDEEGRQVISNQRNSTVEEVVLPGDKEGSSRLDDGDEDSGKDLVAIEEAGNGRKAGQLPLHRLPRSD